MPIKPENRERYPKDWGEVSFAIKQRAEWHEIEETWRVRRVEIREITGRKK